MRQRLDERWCAHVAAHALPQPPGEDERDEEQSHFPQRLVSGAVQGMPSPMMAFIREKLFGEESDVPRQSQMAGSAATSAARGVPAA